MCRQKQDILNVEACHVGQTMDAFLTPGAMFNYDLENLVTSTSTEGELDRATTNK